MSFTSEDMQNANAYANERLKLLQINYLYKKYPHIATHLSYRITQADKDKDYYYTEAFASKAIRVDVAVDKVLCEKLSCNTAKRNGDCSTTEDASYYRVGNTDQFEVSCNPACYNLTSKVEYDDDGNRKSQMMRTMWSDNKNKCVLVPPNFAWAELPLYRSSERYEKRVNDLPVGFNVGPYNPVSSTGVTFEYNKQYCDAFFDEWDESNKDCYVPWYEKILNTVVGESIVKMAKAGITLIENGSTFPDTGLPDPPDIDPKYLLENWLVDIDKSFINPDPDIVLGQRSVEYSYKINDNILEQIEYNLKKERQYRASVKNKKSKEKNDTKVEEKKTREAISVTDTIKNALLGFLESTTEAEFWEQLGIGVVSEVLLSQLKKAFLNLADKIIPKLTNSLLSAGTKFFSTVLERSVLSVAANTVARVTLKFASSLLIKLCALLAQLASVIGIILAVITLFDLILGFWDPLGFNNKYPKEILPTMVESAEYGLRNSMETNDLQVNFALICNLLIEQEDAITLGIEMFQYTYDYLNSLDVNSEGSRIDKGTEVDTDTSVDTDEILAASKIYTAKDFYTYENEHSKRMTFFPQVKNYILISFALGSFFIVINVYFVAILFYIACVLLLFLGYLNSTINIGKIIDKSTLYIKN